VIITTWRIRRTLVNKINLLVNLPRSIEASRLALVKAKSIFLRRASGCLGTSRGSSRIVPLVVDYFASAARLAASARRAARHADRRAARRRLLHLRCATGCLGTSRGSSRGSLRRSSSTTSPTPRVRVPRHVARPVTRLIVDYSLHRDFVLWPRWLYFSHAVRRDYLSRGNTGSTSSTPRTAITSSSDRIASTIHLD
jgi:hypothetical protein